MAIYGIYNKKTLEFLDAILKVEEFKEWTSEYVRFWGLGDEATSDGESCTVCTFQMSAKDDQKEMIKNVFSMVNQFAKRMPVSPVGLVMTWYLLSKKLLLSMEEAAAKLDPHSIFFHFNIGCCASVMKKSVRDVLRNIAWFKREHRNGNIMTGAEEKMLEAAYANETAGCYVEDPPMEPVVRKPRVPEEDESSPQGDDEEAEIAAEENGMLVDMYKARKAIKLKSLCSFIRAYIKDVTFGCKGETDVANKSECVYASPGDIGEAIRNRTMPVDSRYLVSRKWFEKNMGVYMSYGTYMSDELYPHGQLGVSVADYSGEREEALNEILNSKGNVERAISMMDSQNLYKKEKLRSVEDYITVGTGNKIASLFSMMEAGDCAVPQPSDFLTDDQRNEMVDNRQEETWTAILNRTERLVAVHSIAHGARGDSTFRACADIFPKCVWCDIGVIPEIRAGMLDLVNSARKKIKQVAMVHEAGMKKCDTLLFHRPFKRKRISKRIGYGGELVPGSRTNYQREKKGLISGRVVRGGIKSMSPKQVMVIFNQGFDRFDEDLLAQICACASKESDVFTYSYDAQMVSYDALQASFEESCAVKLPFMLEVMRYVALKIFSNNTKRAQAALFKHLIPSQSIQCCINLRAISVETDAYSTMNHTCLLPSAVQAIKTRALYDVKDIVQEVDGVNKRIRDHRLTYRVSSIGLKAGK